MAKYTGSGAVASADFKTIKWVGKDKAGSAVTITLTDAINLGNIDLSMVEKDDIVPALTFTATYSNTDAASTSTTEPWTLETTESNSGASEIVLGAGIFYIGETAVALTRGGGSFNVEREFREIHADGDRGPVKGRITMEGSRATLTMNVLTWLTRITDAFAGIVAVS